MFIQSINFYRDIDQLKLIFFFSLFFIEICDFTADVPMKNKMMSVKVANVAIKTHRRTIIIII